MRTKKSFGQHFLRDRNIISKIVEAFDNIIVDNNDKVHVIEIGPGDGALTSVLVERFNSITLIESDKEVFDLMTSVVGDRISDIVHEDAMQSIVAKILQLESYGKKVFIISNLPYNVGSIILLNAISVMDKWNGGVFMLQKEVVDRIISVCRSKNYGKISIMFQLFCNIKRIMNVSGNAFRPTTQVNSTVFTLLPNQENIAKFIKYYDQISNFLTIAFSSRRKFMIKTLYALFEKDLVDRFYSDNNLCQSTRIEELKPIQVASMMEYLSS